MGVYLPNIEIPKNCYDCQLCDGIANTDYGPCAWCKIDGKARDAYTRQDCPALPVHPHGRLGDLDVLYSEMETYSDYCGAKEYHDDEMIHRDSILYAIEQAPTIIPAEVGDVNDEV